MNTLLLVDVSEAMLASLHDGLQFKDAAWRGVLGFVDQTVKDGASVGLCAFSTKAAAVVAFTSDVQDIRKGLYDLVCEGKEVLLPGAIKVALDQVFARTLARQSCQVILVTASALSSDVTPQYLKAVRLSAYTNVVRLHVVAFGASPSASAFAVHKELAAACFGSCYTVDLAQTRSLKPAFSALIRDHYAPSSHSLAVGHLRDAGLSLRPDPRTSAVQLGGAVRVAPLPRDLSVIGFLPCDLATAPQLLSQHVIHPAPIAIAAASTPKRASVCDLLLRGLKETDTVAVVQLNSQGAASWCGFVYSMSAAADPEHKYLLLSVLHPDCDLPWLGKLTELGPLSKAQAAAAELAQKETEDFEFAPTSAGVGAGAGSAAGAGETKAGKALLETKRGVEAKADALGPARLLPLHPARAPSYAVRGKCSINVESVERRFERVERYATLLPRKLQKLCLECDKLRALSATYHVPHIPKALLEVMQSSLKKAVKLASVTMLQDIVNQLERLPLTTPLTVPAVPVEAPPAAAAPSSQPGAGASATGSSSAPSSGAGSAAVSSKAVPMDMSS